jgi:iron complex outermembrane recepter protein
MTRHSRSRLSLLACLPLFAAAATSRAAETAPAPDQPAEELLRLSLEELVNLEVTTVSRKSERLSEAAAAVFVITQDDLRRQGIRSLPEALRLAPGMTALQIDGSKWAVGSRGVTGRFANKLLVLMDGRILYTPSFSGVFWDVQDTLLEDIDRIEVIRGPGATLWGANAVSGVINIITRKANVEPGSLASARVEQDGSHLASLRHAGNWRGVDFRAYLKTEEQHANEGIAGNDAGDHWHVTRAGVRAELARGDSTWTLISDHYTGRADITTRLFAQVPPQYFVPRAETAELDGSFVIGRFEHHHADGADTSVQVAADFTSRDALQYEEDRQTLSFDVQHRRGLGRHDVVLGVSARTNDYDVGFSETVALTNPSPSDDLVALYLRDEITLVQDRLRLTLGARAEANSLSDEEVELLPTARLLWQVAPGTNAWAAVTGAVRTPAQADVVARVTDFLPVVPPGQAPNPFPVPLRFRVNGNPDFRSEDLLSWEAGLRGPIGGAFSYDLAVYYMEYRGARLPVPTGQASCNPSGTPVAANPLCLFTSDSVIADFLLTNGIDGFVRGGELTLNWDVTGSWRLRGSYSLAQERLSVPGALYPASGPEQQVGLRSEWTLSRNVNLAAFARYVDRVPLGDLPDYWQVSGQLNWTPAQGWQVGLGVRDLFDAGRVEYLSELNDTLPTRIEPAAYAQVRWTF